MTESKLRTQSMDFAVQMISLVKALKEKRGFFLLKRQAEQQRSDH